MRKDHDSSFEELGKRELLKMPPWHLALGVVFGIWISYYTYVNLMPE